MSQNQDWQTKYNTILVLNIRSISKHFDEFLVLLNTMNPKPAILALTETWLSNNLETNMYTIEGYHPIISKNRESRGGGVAIYVRNDLTYEINQIDEALECVSISIYANKRKFINNYDWATMFYKKSQNLNI